MLITRREFDEIKNQNLDVIPLIQQSIETFSQQYKHKHIQLEKTLPENYMLSTHTEVFQIIINNLISNAFKFTPKQGSIIIQLENKTLRISNTGPGISPEHYDTIRNRFYKYHTNEEDD